MREEQPGTRTGSELQRRYPVALLLYGVLAALCWFTVGEGKIVVVREACRIEIDPDADSGHLRPADGTGPPGGQDSPRWRVDLQG